MRGAAVLVSTGGSFSFVPGVAAAGERVFVSPYLAGDERLDRRYAELHGLVHWKMWPSFATITHDVVDDYARFDYNMTLTEGYRLVETHDTPVPLLKSSLEIELEAGGTGSFAPACETAPASRLCSVADILPRHALALGSACSTVEVAGMQSSGSTLVYNILRTFNERFNLGWKIRKNHAVTVDDLQCAIVTYRDPRDVVCSAARRQGHCFECDAHELQEHILEQLELIFFGSAPADGQWAAKVEVYFEARAKRGLEMLRYESFVACLPNLIDALAAHFGLVERLTPTLTAEIAATWSVANVAGIVAKLADFTDADHETHLHGHHISNEGRIRGWLTCLTPSTRRRVESSLGSVFELLNYTKLG